MPVLLESGEGQLRLVTGSFSHLPRFAPGRNWHLFGFLRRLPRFHRADPSTALDKRTGCESPGRLSEDANKIGRASCRERGENGAGEGGGKEKKEETD